MKTFGMIAAAILVAGSAAAGGKENARGLGADGTSWGDLTKGAVSDGFDQGGHSSDPSGDGHGPGTVDEPRKGLANVIERGNLGATTDFISGALGE